MKILSLILLFLAIKANTAQATDLSIGGYTQANPVHIRAELPPPLGESIFWEYRLQNRLNLRWNATSHLDFHWQMRNRFFAGDLVQEFPFYANQIDTDEGIVNLSWMVTEQDDWFVHHIPDRLYTEWDRGNWNIRIGRQRINWGINTITNPNDLFNIYSFYDFDYPERPGSDAVRIQYFRGFGSRAELALRTAEDLQNSIAAGLYAFNAYNFDFQVIGGYYRERATLGGGWASDVSGIGFKGETMFYADIDADNDRETNFIASASADYMFRGGFYGMMELLYNHEGGRETFLLMTETLTPDNPSFSRYQITTRGRYPFHTLVNGSLSLLYYPDESTVFVSPQVTWSVLQDMDFILLGQFFVGSDDSVFGTAGNLGTATLKYHF